MSLINYKVSTIQLKSRKGEIINGRLEEFQSVTLPYELINKIFSYIQSNTNQIIKIAITQFYIPIYYKYNSSRYMFSLYNIKIALIAARLNISWDNAFNEIEIREKYFKYSTLHDDRKRLIIRFKSDVKRSKFKGKFELIKLIN